MPTKIDLRPYIQNPNLYITAGLLTSLEDELCFYTDLAKIRPEYQRFIREIENEIHEVKAALEERYLDDQYHRANTSTKTLLYMR